MKILIIGNGGREHALAWKIAQNKKVSKIYAALGNAYHSVLDHCEQINLSSIDDLLAFAKAKNIDLTIVGSEALLVAGIVDIFQANNLNIFGANKKAAQLEGSKSYAKKFMQKYGVKTALAQSFSDKAQAAQFAHTLGLPVVIKASGLAAGKGVIIAQNEQEIVQALDDIMVKKVFGDSGDEVVIEQFLQGIEISILSLTDCNSILPFISAKDHKKIGEGETGLNTGGMGVIAPNPAYRQEVHQQFIEDILKPTLRGLQAEHMDFAGVIFFGLMLCDDGVYLLEYNMRLGDPETQALLPLLKNDLLDLIDSAQKKQLSDRALEWEEMASCCVVLSAGGYPLAYEKGKHISGIPTLKNCKDILVFFAGVTEQEGEYYTNGGRVLNIVALAPSVKQARETAYNAIQQIDFNDKYYRNDIGE